MAYCVYRSEGGTAVYSEIAEDASIEVLPVALVVWVLPILDPLALGVDTSPIVHSSSTAAS